MNISQRTQRELSVQSGNNLAEDVDLLASMIGEAIAAKVAWVSQVETMVQQEQGEEARETLRLIRLDEVKHIRLLRELGNVSNLPKLEGVASPQSPLTYSKAAQLKLKSGEFVRRIYYNVDDTPTRDTLFEIICDDTNNAIRFTLMAQT